MTQLPLEHQAEIEVSMRALMASENCSMVYPPIEETITIICDTHPSYKRVDGSVFPFVRYSAIPERFHAHIKEIGLGSTCPAPDDKHDALWLADVDRWLRAIGIKAEFIHKTGEQSS